MKKIQSILFLVTAALIISIPSLTYPETVTHTYDDLNRLIRSEYSGGAVLLFEYDKLGNRTVKKKLYKPHTLTIQKTGEGAGVVTSAPARINCGEICSQLFSEGFPITLTATPDPSSLFIQWSGGGCSGNGSCVLTVTADTSVSAVFQTCSSLPVMIVGRGYYPTLYDAYHDQTIPEGSTITIRTQNVTLIENFEANRSINLTLDGGYNCDYSANTGSPTILKGMLTTRYGRVTIGNFILQN